MDCSLPGSSVHGIFQAIVLEWIAISFSRGSSQPRDRTWVSYTVDRRFTVWATAKSIISFSPHNTTDIKIVQLALEMLMLGPGNIFWKPDSVFSLLVLCLWASLQIQLGWQNCMSHPHTPVPVHRPGTATVQTGKLNAGHCTWPFVSSRQKILDTGAK